MFFFSLRFSRILSDCSWFPHILSDSFGLFRILSHFSGISMILSDFWGILSYTHVFFWIQTDFLEFSRIFSYSFEICLVLCGILSDSLELWFFRILSYPPIFFPSIPWSFRNFVGFFHILPYSFGFTWIFSNSSIFSYILRYSLVLFWISRNTSRTLSDTHGFLRILSNFLEFSHILSNYFRIFPYSLLPSYFLRSFQNLCQTQNIRVPRSSLKWFKIKKPRIPDILPDIFKIKTLETLSPSKFFQHIESTGPRDSFKLFQTQNNMSPRDSFKLFQNQNTRGCLSL